MQSVSRKVARVSYWAPEPLQLELFFKGLLNDGALVVFLAPHF